MANFRLAVREDDISPEISIINFHYAYPEAVQWNQGLHRVIGYDESGFAGRDDHTYRRQAWNFIMSGGGLFNSLDYSFFVGAEGGTAAAAQAPGGGSPTLRRQLKILHDFLHQFDLATLHPDHQTVIAAPGVVARLLSHPGHTILAYLEGRGPTTLELQLAPGPWQVEWVDVESGEIVSHATVVATNSKTIIASPAFVHEIAMRLFR